MKNQRLLKKKILIKLKNLFKEKKLRQKIK